MAETRIKFTLEGELIPLTNFAAGMKALADMFTALDRELNRKSDIQFFIEDLAPGSATTTMRIESQVEERLKRFSAGIEVIGGALQNRTHIPYNASVRKAADRIMSVVGGSVTAATFESEDCVFRATTGEQDETESTFTAFGSIVGDIDTVTRHNRFAFTLYDSLFQRAITCFFQSNQGELVRAVWGQHVRVVGRIHRDGATGRVLRIDQITDIVVLTLPEPGVFRNAKGILSGLQSIETADLVGSLSGGE